ncbi:MAG: peptide chain release factor 1 [Patescibacteria group bacterium]|nr:peptide chain release factor 1 [Patescibacteria group bacterium]
MEEKLKKIKEEYEKINQELSSPEIVSDTFKMTKLSKRAAELRFTVDLINRYEEVAKQIKENEELIESEQDEDLVAMATDDLTNLQTEFEKLKKDLEVELLPKDPNDSRNAIMEIRAGAGGDEAALFAAELFRMYSRFAENKGWKIEIMNSNRTGIGGFKEIIFAVKGDNVYKSLKYESGVHRVQRVPVTEKQGRIQTSTVTIVVLPEVPEVEFKIEPKDLRIDTFCSQGAGGQSVNTTYSAIRITHLPTGIVASCQDERSQQKNKAKAMKVLRSRVLAQQEEERTKKAGAERKMQIGTGDRSEKIRTYNFPQDRVTDHRIKFTTNGIPSILGGNLDPILDKLKEEDLKLLISRMP